MYGACPYMASEICADGRTQAQRGPAGILTAQKAAAPRFVAEAGAAEVGPRFSRVWLHVVEHHFPIGRWTSIHAGLLPLAIDRGPIRGPVRERRQLTHHVKTPPSRRA